MFVRNGLKVLNVISPVLWGILNINDGFYFPSKEDFYRIKLKTENTVIDNYIRNPIIFL